MRLIEVLALTVVLSAFLGLFTSLFSSTLQVYERTALLRAELRKDSFICSRVKNISFAHCMSVWEELQNIKRDCSAFFPNETIHIEKRAFVPFGAQGERYEITWQTNGKRRSIIVEMP